MLICFEDKFCFGSVLTLALSTNFNVILSCFRRIEWCCYVAPSSSSGILSSDMERGKLGTFLDYNDSEFFSHYHMLKSTPP